MSGNTRVLQKNLAEMASGSRINKSADDAAGMALSKDMEMHLRSANQANRNTNDAISLIQIAEGSFNELNTMMVRLRELSVMAASDSISDTERGMLNKEVVQLRSEMDRISKTTQWTNQKLLSHDGGTIEFQVGIHSDTVNNQIQVNFGELDVRSATIGMDGVDLSTKEGAQQGLSQLDEAQNTLNGRRATIGAIQNRLTSSLDNLSTQSENMAAAHSQIKDTDMAKATAQVIQSQIMANAGVATLAQANQNQNVALKLI